MATVGWDAGRRKTLTIPSGQTETNVLDLGLGPKTTGRAYRRLDILIMAPAVLTGVVTVHVCDTEGGTFQPLTSGGSNVTLAAAKATPLAPGLGRFLKIISGSAEAADRAFILTAAAHNV